MATEWHFGAFLSFVVNIYWHCQGWGLTPTPLPPILEIQLEAETHPVTVGFSHCLAVFDDRSSLCFNPGSLLLCMRPKQPFHGSLVLCSFSLSHVTTCLPIHWFKNSLGLISCSSTYIPPTEHDQIPSPNKINYSYVLFLGSSLFIYLNIHWLLLVAHCQLSSSTMGILLTLHLSRQHITAYLY